MQGAWASCRCTRLCRCLCTCVYRRMPAHMSAHISIQGYMFVRAHDHPYHPHAYRQIFGHRGTHIWQLYPSVYTYLAVILHASLYTCLCTCLHMYFFVHCMHVSTLMPSHTFIHRYMSGCIHDRDMSGFTLPCTCL